MKRFWARIHNILFRKTLNIISTVLSGEGGALATKYYFKNALTPLKIRCLYYEILIIHKVLIL